MREDQGHLVDFSSCMCATVPRDCACVRVCVCVCVCMWCVFFISIVRANRLRQRKDVSQPVAGRKRANAFIPECVDPLVCVCVCVCVWNGSCFCFDDLRAFPVVSLLSFYLCLVLPHSLLSPSLPSLSATAVVPACPIGGREEYPVGARKETPYIVYSFLVSGGSLSCVGEPRPCLHAALQRRKAI